MTTLVFVDQKCLGSHPIMDQSGGFLGSLSLPDKEPEGALENAEVGF
jgi:hypothetical protein